MDMLDDSVKMLTEAKSLAIMARSAVTTVQSLRDEVVERTSDGAASYDGGVEY